MFGQKETECIDNTGKERRMQFADTAISNANEINIFMIPLPFLSLCVVFLPVFGLAFAVVWSIIFDKERSTSTACHVR